MRDIHLHGHLAESFGALHRLEVDSAGEAIKALCILHKGFRDQIREGSYRVIRGDDADTGRDVELETLYMRLGRPALHIVPQISGSGRGAGKAILGVALIAFAFVAAPAAIGAAGAAGAGGAAAGGMAATAFTAFGSAITYGNIAMIGVSMALSGISSALSPRPKAVDLVQQDERPSFIFNGAVNNIEQGGIVPVWYGRIRVGSTVISGGLQAEQI